MIRNRYNLPGMAVAAAVFRLPVNAATDAERIRVLEEQLATQKSMMEQQQRMLQTMANECRCTFASFLAR